MSQRLARNALIGLAVTTAALLVVLLFSWTPEHHDHYTLIDTHSEQLRKQAAAYHALLEGAYAASRDLTAQEMYNGRTWLGSIQRLSCEDLQIVSAVRDMMQAYTMLQTFRASSQRERYETEYLKARDAYQQALLPATVATCTA